MRHSLIDQLNIIQYSATQHAEDVYGLGRSLSWEMAEGHGDGDRGHAAHNTAADPFCSSTK